MDQFAFSSYRLPVEPTPFWEMLSFITVWAWLLCQRPNDHICVALFCIFNSIPLINMSVSVPIACVFNYYFSVIEFEVKDDDFP